MKLQEFIDINREKIDNIHKIFGTIYSSDQMITICNQYDTIVSAHKLSCETNGIEFSYETLFNFVRYMSKFKLEHGDEQYDYYPSEIVEKFNMVKEELFRNDLISWEVVKSCDIDIDIDTIVKPEFCLLQEMTEKLNNFVYSDLTISTNHKTKILNNHFNTSFHEIDIYERLFNKIFNKYKIHINNINNLYISLKNYCETIGVSEQIEDDTTWISSQTLESRDDNCIINDNQSNNNSIISIELAYTKCFDFFSKFENIDDIIKTYTNVQSDIKQNFYNKENVLDEYKLETDTFVSEFIINEQEDHVPLGAGMNYEFVKNNSVNTVYKNTNGVKFSRNSDGILKVVGLDVNLQLREVIMEYEYVNDLRRAVDLSNRITN